jgi:hypothetical protein
VSVSLRKFRAYVYDYSDTGTDGEIVPTYLLHASGAADGAWWCARAVPTGREVTTGMAADHRIDSVLNFSAHAPINDDSLVIVDGVSYFVRAILARDYGRDELEAWVERAPDGADLDPLSGIIRASQVVAEVLVAA